MKIETVFFSSGQIIFLEGDPSNGIYLIREGTVEIYRVRDNTEIFLGVLNAGDVLGTMTLLSREPRTASARATVQCVLVYYPIENIYEGFKAIPTWAQAIIKDTIARVKFVNDKLVEAKLQERNLLRNIGTIYHHAGQLAFLLASFIQKTNYTDETNTKIYPLHHFVTEGEFIILKKYSYLEKIFLLFIHHNLIQVADNKKYGKVAINPSPQFIEDFANFSLALVKKGTSYFIPRKCYSWLSGLIRIAKKNPSVDKYTKETLSELLQLDLNRQDAPILLEELIKLNMVKEDEKKMLSFSQGQLHRVIIFEGLARALKDLKT